jgi:hypothetical protein
VVALEVLSVVLAVGGELAGGWQDRAVCEEEKRAAALEVFASKCANLHGQPAYVWLPPPCHTKIISRIFGSGRTAGSHVAIFGPAALSGVAGGFRASYELYFELSAALLRLSGVRMTNGDRSIFIVKARPTLQALDIGDDVAEFDERLSSYFVQTSSFRDIVIDKADLILGSKGSGKSAIFKYLANPNADVPELDDVDIIPAFNVQGSVIFRRLSAGPPASEPVYRFIWFTFIVAMIANHLLSSYADVIDLSRLAKLIDAADLRVGPPFPARLWDKIEALIKSISGRLELEGELEFGIPKLPISAKGKGRLRPRDVASSNPDDQVDLEEVLLICADNLAHLERRCWVVFDRLDEAFEHSRELENTVLRGLMRAHLDVASYGSSIRTKLFLRNDILDRVMQRKGFVNATHLRRLDLQWDHEGIIDLLARRIASNENIATIFNMRPDDQKSTRGRLDICHHILPKFIDGVPLTEWIYRLTTDASKALNPRNVLTLFRLSRQHQLKVYDRDDPELSSVSSLISGPAMMSGLISLSEVRMEDTVYAEFNSLRLTIKALQGKPARFTRKELSDYIHTGRRSDILKSRLETLEYAGIVSVSYQGVITVAPLYRPALGMALSRKTDVTVDEEKSIENKVDSAIEAWPQDSTSINLFEMSMPEKNFIKKYVEEKYPDYIAVFSSGRRLPELKPLTIRERHPKVTIRERHPEAKIPGVPGHDPENISFLLELRAEAAEVEGYFVGPAIELSLALTLVEIDRSLRKNKSRRRIVGILSDSLSVTDLDGDKSMVQLILGSCNAWIIDLSHAREYFTDDLRQSIADMVKSLCDVAVDKGRSVTVTFSCPAVKDFAIDIANQCPNINLVEPKESTTTSRLTAILQPLQCID